MWKNEKKIFQCEKMKKKNFGFKKQHKTKNSTVIFLLREPSARNTYYGSVRSIPIHSYGVEELSKAYAIFDFLMTPTG